MNRADKLTILIVDDQVEVLEIYQEALCGQFGHHVECVSMPAEALRLVRNTLFDIVIVDAKISYKGAPLGGLNLAQEISTILGIDSTILMSQYNVREEVSFFNPELTFLPKPREGGSLLAWVGKDLMGKIHSLLAKQFGFVVMPYGDEEGNEWYRSKLVPWMGETGFRIRRMDEISHTRAISEELMTRIRHSHFVVLYATQRNPNVFFEAGYACALNKYMVVLAPDDREMPFDIRGHFAISLANTTDDQVRGQLHRLMIGLRGLEPH